MAVQEKKKTPCYYESFNPSTTQAKKEMVFVFTKFMKTMLEQNLLTILLH